MFDSLILLGDKDNKANKQTLFNAVYARGIGSSRDSWAYNYSEIVIFSLTEFVFLSTFL